MLHRKHSYWANTISQSLHRPVRNHRNRFTPHARSHRAPAHEDVVDMDVPSTSAAEHERGRVERGRGDAHADGVGERAGESGDVSVGRTGVVVALRPRGDPRGEKRRRASGGPRGAAAGEGARLLGQASGGAEELGHSDALTVCAVDANFAQLAQQMLHAFAAAKPVPWARTWQASRAATSSDDSEAAATAVGARRGRLRQSRRNVAMAARPIGRREGTAIFFSAL